MALTLKTVIQSRIFWLGLFLRLACILFFTRDLHQDLFLPFLLSAASFSSIDPWSIFMAKGGISSAFPYGPAMLLPLIAFSPFMAFESALFESSTGLAFLWIFLPLFLTDLLLLITICEQYKVHAKRILVFYWLSPIVIYITYIHGQLDIIPITMTVVSFFALSKNRFYASGIWLGLAISAKLSMILASPFFLIYLVQNKRLRVKILDFIRGFIGMSIPTVLLPIISPGYREMVLSTPERDRVFSLVMTLDTSIEAQLFIVPLIFFLMLYSAWRLRRSNFHVMFNMTGVTFLLFVLFSPAAPGWFLWALPFLVTYQLYGDKIGHALVAAFSIFSVPFLHAKAAKASAYLFSDPFILSTLNTIVVSLGLVLAFRIFQQGIRGNDFFQLSRRPLTIAIAGDSGAGKDTLAMALEGLFGSHSVTQIFGDTYHKWERGAPMWRSLTHLNPAANDLYRMTNDFLTLISGKPIVTQIYDHNTGRHSRPFAAKSNDVLILSGLHALFPVTLIGSLDVRVFLDTDSLLRAHWKLQRDTEKRNQSKEQIKQMMMRRAVDADRFILPQKQNADIIFRLAPINAEHLVRDSINQHLPLKLLIELSYSLYAERFRRALVAICGAQLDSEISEDGLSVTMEVSGDIWADDIGLAARHLTPNLDEFLGLSPTWESDMLGVMQLVVITHAAEQLRNRN